VTSYSEQSASLRVFLSTRAELWFLLRYLRAIRYLHPYFMTLAFPRLASFIGGILLSLANRCESSMIHMILESDDSHDSSSYITMLFSRAKRLSQISIISFALRSYVCSIPSKLGTSETLLSSISLSLLFYL